ncbi:MAG: condensation domain-containing protein, partial [Acidobacteria bacterium]|nr:condensation domain-containing protein [Acidobacteriota bacterium]
AALLAGGKTVIYNNELILEPRKLVSRLVKDKVTVLEVVPSYLAIMFEHLPLRDSRLYLEYLVITGETLKPHIVDQWFKIYPGIPLVNAYGPTEASDDITHHIMKAPGNDRNIPIGKPVQNFSIYIIDSVMNLCPIGVTGEIWVSGAGVGRGYINRPELTAEKFDQDLWDEKDDQDKKNKSFFRGLRGAVFSKKAPLYKTGDLARWLPNGVIDFLGRKDQQVKIRGFRIELGEIENRLMQYTGIKEAVVIDKAAENGEKYLCAYYVLKKESDREIIPAVELQDYLSAALPHYMVPAYFIKLAKIPLTANGKINTRELPDPEILDHELTGIKVRYMPPQTRLEHTCADVWSDVLGIERERIGIDDNFFQSGGHSLKAVTFLSKLHRELEVKIPLVTLFNFPTIRQLAEYIGNISKTNKARYFSIEPVEKKEYYPLSPAQRRMYIAREMEPGSTVYNVFQIHELGKPDFAKLEKTFQQLIARHESLRTTFHMIHDDLVQRVNDHVPFKIESYDTDKAIENFVRPFDLAEAPLLRVGLIQNRDQYCILLVDMHHIICDGISHDVLVKDFIALYEEKEENILQPLHLQYKDYAQWLDGVKEEINRQQDYWVNQFSKPVPVLNLVTDYPRPATRDFSGSVYSFALEKQPSEKLREYASRMNITLYILFLAIYYILIYKLTLQEDIVIGTPVSGRNHPDLEKIIGMFVNILALRNSPRGDKTFHDWLNELKETTLEAFANQDYQFDELVERVGGNKDAGRNPLFDISFGFETLERREELIPGQPIPQQETSTQRGEDLRPVRRPHKTTRFDLSLYGVDTGAHLVFSFEYSITLFKPERIETFSQYYKEIISSILNNPRERIDQIQISHQLSRASVDFLQDEAIMAEF